MLLAICTTQVRSGKKESNKEILKKNGKNNKVTKNLLQVDWNPDPQNQLELKVSASIQFNSSLKQVPSLFLTDRS